ncbi:uncharacterized protein LACBIDRAFT_307882 [Laccaria bicolor S238N-H82]|uniref:Predicted protein n=1 Tax=Laccaria bicolor (strain S238N-H82 / ATCC MYA-4686) TaxID=486041 RepID=B0DQX7_LACBS|nr:uncharacterized protein LACBIDRAFT_307882 [Laccaria bicolor S238N-H82]EDR03020.1 predicted protein [Laccaria bicolor S238N-H82]|eukprot:XP_001886443.1 predicted protein [Laccaria bicolor S238N-H82]
MQHIEKRSNYPAHVNGCPSKRRFRAGLDGGMIAMGVPPPVHEGISRGLGINGTRGHR